MGSKPILEEEEIEETIRYMLKDSFTVLDFLRSSEEFIRGTGKDLLKGLGFMEAKRDIQ